MERSFSRFVLRPRVNSSALAWIDGVTTVWALCKPSYQRPISCQLWNVVSRTEGGDFAVAAFRCCFATLGWDVFQDYMVLFPCSRTTELLTRLLTLQ